MITRVGTEGAPPVVFLHGGVLNREMWLPVIDRLCDELDCIAIDLPGHGALRGEHFTMQGARLTVARALDDIDVERAALVGLSLGGYVAMDFARAWPDRVRGLLLSGATIAYTGWDGLSTRLYGWALPVLARKTESSLAEKLRHDLEAGHAQQIIDVGISVRGGGEALRRLPGVDYHAQLAGFDKPIMIANGARDEPNRTGEARFLRQHRHATVRVIEDAGHACALQQPTAFAEAVRALMDELTAPED